MVFTGETAPTFSATYGGSDHETFDLEEHLGDGPVVLAFFPGAFTPPCSNEMVAIQDHVGEFEDAGAVDLGVSADSAFGLEAFAEEYGLEFGLVSDVGGAAIDAYDLAIDISELGLQTSPTGRSSCSTRGGDRQPRVGGRGSDRRVGLRGGSRGRRGGRLRRVHIDGRSSRPVGVGRWTRDF